MAQEIFALCLKVSDSFNNAKKSNNIALNIEKKKHNNKVQLTQRHVKNVCSHVMNREAKGRRTVGYH